MVLIDPHDELHNLTRRQNLATFVNAVMEYSCFLGTQLFEFCQQDQALREHRDKTVRQRRGDAEKGYPVMQFHLPREHWPTHLESFGVAPGFSFPVDRKYRALSEESLR